ncbi:MAG: PDZ domain-containing protein, partial [Methanosarcinales archaeon]|nr:PDZ domain-containing protein [Methanosarcinales archaeon]
IIISLDNVEINNVRDLIKMMNKHAVGDKVSLGLFRGQGKIQLDIVLEKAPTPPLSPPVQPAPPPT